MIETIARHIGYLRICFFDHLTWFFCLIFSKPSFYLTVSNLEQMLQMSCLEFMHKLSWSFTNHKHILEKEGQNFVMVTYAYKYSPNFCYCIIKMNAIFIICP